MLVTREAGRLRLRRTKALARRPIAPGRQVLAYVRCGDTLVTWKLDWFNRLMAHLIEPRHQIVPALGNELERDQIGSQMLVSSIPLVTTECGAPAAGPRVPSS